MAEERAPDSQFQERVAAIGLTWRGPRYPGTTPVSVWIKTSYCGRDVGGSNDCADDNNEGWHTLLLRDSAEGKEEGEEDGYLRSSNTEHASRLRSGSKLMLVVGER